MQKTSLYLSEEDRARLAELAAQEGRSQAEIMRDALRTYAPEPRRDRDFALLRAAAPGDGRSVADIDEDELLLGFGE